MKQLLIMLLFVSCNNIKNDSYFVINDSVVFKTQQYRDSFYYYSKLHTDFCDLSSGYFNKSQEFYNRDRLDSYFFYKKKFDSLNDTIRSLSKKCDYYYHKLDDVEK